MTELSRDALERALARLNEPLLPAERVTLAQHTPTRFTLRFPPPLTLPEDQCLDQRFTAVQFLLHGTEKVDTGIQGAEWREDDNAYFVEYEVIDW